MIKENNVPLTQDEEAAIRYIRGYLIKSIIKQLYRNNHDDKHKYLYLWFLLLEDPESSEENMDVFQIENWSKIIERGK